MFLLINSLSVYYKKKENDDVKVIIRNTKVMDFLQRRTSKSYGI